MIDVFLFCWVSVSLSMLVASLSSEVVYVWIYFSH
jgi:hypothetical protein